MEPFHIYFVAGTPLKSYIWLPCPCQTSSKPLPPTFCNFLLCYVLYKVCALQHTGVIVEKHNFINGRQPAARHLRRPSAFALLPWTQFALHITTTKQFCTVLHCYTICTAHTTTTITLFCTVLHFNTVCIALYCTFLHFYTIWMAHFCIICLLDYWTIAYVYKKICTAHWNTCCTIHIQLCLTHKANVHWSKRI